MGDSLNRIRTLIHIHSWHHKPSMPATICTQEHKTHTPGWPLDQQHFFTQHGSTTAARGTGVKRFNTGCSAPHPDKTLGHEAFRRPCGAHTGFAVHCTRRTCSLQLQTCSPRLNPTAIQSPHGTPQLAGRSTAHCPWRLTCPPQRSSLHAADLHAAASWSAAQLTARGAPAHCG